LTANFPFDKTDVGSRVSIIRKWGLESTGESINLLDLVANLEIAWRALLRTEAQQRSQHAVPTRGLTKTEEIALELFGIQSLRIELERASNEGIRRRASLTKNHSLSQILTGEKNQENKGSMEFQITNEIAPTDLTAASDISLSPPIPPNLQKNYPKTIDLQVKRLRPKALSIFLIREILRHRLQLGKNRNATAREFNVAQGTVTAFTQLAKQAGWSWEHIEKLNGAELLAAMRPDKAKQRRVEPNFVAVHDWIRGGRKRRDAWKAYRDRYGALQTFSYPQFCKRYATWLLEAQFLDVQSAS